MKFDMRWLDTIGSVEKGIDLVNKLYWYLDINKVGDQWFVKSGEKVIFSSDSRDAIDIFLYGLALAYGILPDKVFENLQKEIEGYA